MTSNPSRRIVRRKDVERLLQVFSWVPQVSIFHSRSILSSFLIITMTLFLHIFLEYLHENKFTEKITILAGNRKTNVKSILNS